MKNSLIAALLALITLLLLSDFDFFTSQLYFPNFLWILPFYLFFRLSLFYFQTIFKGQLSNTLKIVVILGNLFCLGLFVKLGFEIWKPNQGNILMSLQENFKINAKNIWFWVVFQSYLILCFFSAFKLLVTWDQK